MKRARIFLLIPTFQPNDAVGNDVLGMYHAYREAGYETHVVAQHVHEAHSSITELIGSETDRYWRDPNDIIIYHHAIAWEPGEKILAKAKNKIVIKYHNVTPAEFYTRYSDFYYWACINGIETTKRLAKIPNIWVWGDSAFNAGEFVELGVPPHRTRVVAPVHKIDELGRVPFDAVVAGVYREPPANVLFVGAMRPNKGHTKALDTLAALKWKTDVPVRLLFVGNFDGNLARYRDEVDEYIRQLEFGNEVVVASSVTPAQLRAYYMTASVFLCVSEHEGFCVPLVEAMSFRVPIVAWAQTAVGETAGDSGRVYDNFDPEQISGGVAEILENPALGRELAAKGRHRYENVFHTKAIRRKLLDLVEEVAQS